MEATNTEMLAKKNLHLSGYKGPVYYFLIDVSDITQYLVSTESVARSSLCLSVSTFPILHCHDYKNAHLSFLTPFYVMK